MKGLLLCLLAVILLFERCTDKKATPSAVLPKDKMEQVLWDMIQADRFATLFLVKDTSRDLKTETFKLYEQVFAIHNISKEKFINSYNFYLSRPDMAKVLFDSLSEMANRRRAEIYEPKEKDTVVNRQ